MDKRVFPANGNGADDVASWLFCAGEGSDDILRMLLLVVVLVVLLVVEVDLGAVVRVFFVNVRA